MPRGRPRQCLSAEWGLRDPPCPADGGATCDVATKGEGTQNLLCAYLAAAVLVGLLGNTFFGLWWLDPVAALVIATMAIREGLESWRGEGCCELEFASVPARD